MANNTYDRDDFVRREHALIAGGLKYAAYRVKNHIKGDYSDLQHHFTFDNTVLANMPDRVAKAFIGFWDDVHALEGDRLTQELFSAWGDIRFAMVRREPTTEGALGEIVYTAYYHDMVVAVLSPASAQLFVRMAREDLDA